MIHLKVVQRGSKTVLSRVAAHSKVVKVSPKTDFSREAAPHVELQLTLRSGNLPPYYPYKLIAGH